MASLFVAAIVVSHAKADYLKQALEAVKSQTHPISQIVVVETAGDLESIELAKSMGLGVISPGDLRLGSAINAGLAALQEKPGWVWVLHEDCLPDQDALEHLARAAEISPSVAIIGPKLLNLQNPIQIQQMGLTLTRTGRPFLKVEDEYDQGQHDSAGDSLAVSTAGMLFATAAWEMLGGLDDTSPTLAQDIELGLKARAAGFRVVVEAKARVLHQGLSLSGNRSRGWLQGSPGVAISKAHIHLATLVFPWWIVVLGYLSLPVIVIASIPANLLEKRPLRIFSQLSSWIWAWATSGKRFAAKARLRKLGKVSGARVLFAKGPEVRKRRRAGLIQEPIQDEKSRTSLFGSNSGWLALLPLLASFQMFPTGSLTTKNFSPLSPTFGQIWSGTSAESLSLPGAPADPLVWFYAAMGALSPQNPSFGLSVFVFLAPALVFLGTWLLVSVFVERFWVRNFSALTMSLGPVAIGASFGGQVVELIAMTFIPWGLFFLLRATLAYNSARTWRWVGLSGLCLSFIAVTSPVAFAFFAVIILGLGVFRTRKLLILVWSLLPGLALLYPFAAWSISQGDFKLLTVAGSGFSPPISYHTEIPNVAFIGILLLVSVLGALKARPSLLAALGILALLSFAVSFFQFYSSSLPVYWLACLALVIIGSLGLSTLQKRAWSAPISSILIAATLGSGVWFGLLGKPLVSFEDDQLMPALVNASSDSGMDIRTLVLTPGDFLTAKIIYGNGLSQDRKYVAESLWLGPNVAPELDLQIARLAANLAAGISSEIPNLLASTSVDFVLLKNDDAALSSSIELAINSIPELQSAGVTAFGALWRVDGSSQDLPSSQVDHTVRDFQLLVLVLFGLLAIPTPASIRGYRRAKAGELE